MKVPVLPECWAAAMNAQHEPTYISTAAISGMPCPDVCIPLVLLGCYNREPRLNSEHIRGNLHSAMADGNAAINLREFSPIVLYG